MNPSRSSSDAPKRSSFRVFLQSVMLLMALLSPPRFGLAEADTPTDLQSKLDQKGTIVLGERATLAEWVLAIQQEWDVNIVCSGDVQAQVVSGGFADTPLRNVLDAILFSSDCGYEVVKNSLLIQKLDDLGVMKPQFTLEIIPLLYISPNEAEPTVRIMLSKSGTVQTVPSSKSLIVADLPERVAKIREHLNVLEKHAQELAEQEKKKQQPLPSNSATLNRAEASASPADGAGPAAPPEPVTEVYAAQFVSAEMLIAPLQSALGTEARVSSMTADNRLIVVGPPNVVQLATQLIRRLDVPEAQVRISAIMYDVTLESLERLGVNWNHNIKGRINAAGDPQSMLELNSGMFKMSAPATSGGDGGSSGGDGGSGTGDAATTAASTAINGMWTITNLSRHFDLAAFIEALDQTDGARLLARPTILAYNREEAEIKIISEIPVQELTQTQQGGNIGTTTFREAGVILTVTPEIMEDHTVLLNVAPEFSVLSGYSAQGQPIIDRRTTKTRVHMADGQTIVIGGLLRRNELETVTGIPGLMNWKYVGMLFRHHETNISDSELLVFLRTEIILPECLLKPREEIALGVAEERLEQIPVATNYPFIPPCHDCHCPYHNPRPYGGPPAGMCIHYNDPQPDGEPEPVEAVPSEPGLSAPEPPAPAADSPDPSPDIHQAAMFDAPRPASRTLVRRLPPTAAGMISLPQVASRPQPPPALAEAREPALAPTRPSRLVQPAPLPPERVPSAPPASGERMATRRGLWLDDVFRR